VSAVQVGPLSDEQRGALADLLGLSRLPPEHTSVSLRRLDEIVRDAVGVGVREVVAELIGPIGDRAARRRLDQDERAGLWSWLERHPVVAAQPVLAGWAAEVRRTGLVGGSVPDTRQFLESVLGVLAELPASGIPLPVLADQLLHDPHGLDDDTRRAKVVTRALATIYQVAPPTGAQQRRALWERAGVAEDELSSTVLAAGIRPLGPDPASQVLRICADGGQAAVLTLAQLRGVPPWRLRLPATVSVFENPSVLALAMARFGAGCPPIVCLSGWPSGAGVALLRILASAGCTLRYHGDFDGEGLRIAANVQASTGATPWRMDAADYREALRGAPAGPPVGKVTEAPWDPELAGALRDTDIAVSEERVAGGLLDALAGT
jgi:uncharacterized protein (TIGR02679 family)